MFQCVLVLDVHFHTRVASTGTAEPPAQPLLVFFCLFVCFWSKVSCKPGWLQIHYGAVNDLQFLTLSPQTPDGVAEPFVSLVSVVG